MGGGGVPGHGTGLTPSRPKDLGLGHPHPLPNPDLGLGYHYHPPRLEMNPEVNPEMGGGVGGGHAGGLSCSFRIYIHLKQLLVLRCSLFERAAMFKTFAHLLLSTFIRLVLL